MEILSVIEKVMPGKFNKPAFYTVWSGPLRHFKLYSALRHGIKKILGIYEKDVVNFILQQVKPGDYCLDVGAHIGYVTFIMARAVGNKGKVMAFEPNDESYTFLQTSIKKNDIKNVKLSKYALGEENRSASAHVWHDSAMINFEDSGFINYKGLATRGSMSYLMTSLDNIFNESNKISRLDFIKIDVEGYEDKVLRGSINLLKRFKPRLLVEVHGKDKYKPLYGFLKGIGYSISDLQKNILKEDSEFDSDVFHIFCK